MRQPVTNPEPFSWKNLAVVLPIPLEAPVIRIVLLMSLSFSGGMLF
jgi:hypothetical protein